MPELQEVADTFEEDVRRVAMRYDGCVTELLKQVKAKLEAAGLRVEGPDGPTDFVEEDHRWELIVWRSSAKPELHDCVDVKVELCDSWEFEGVKEGINWSFDIVHAGGVVIGGVTPCNYTSEVWVDVKRKGLVRDRWEILKKAVLGANIATDIERWFEQNPRKEKPCTPIPTPSA